MLRLKLEAFVSILGQLRATYWRMLGNWVYSYIVGSTMSGLKGGAMRKVEAIEPYQ